MKLDGATALSFAKLPPAEGIAYLKAKGFRLTFDYDEMMHEAHHHAFTVAKIQRADLLEDIRASLLKAQAEGQSYAAWKKQIKPTLIAKGWWGTFDAVNKDTGEVKTITVGGRRLRTIFYTNMRVAYQVGKARELYARDTVTHLRYIAILDNRTRRSHAAMHGKVLPKDHPWWATNFPPNGWNCRCRVAPVSPGRLQRYRDAGKVVEPDEAVGDIASGDWAYDVRYDALSRLTHYAAAKLKTTKEKLIAERNHAVRTQQLAEMVEEVIVKGNQKYPVSVIEVGALSARVLSSVTALLKHETEAEGIVLEKNQLLHARPDRKSIYGQALRVEEFRQIVDVIAEEKEVYIETKPGREAVIYLFEDAHDPERVNKIVVNINKRVKKFGTTNAIVTLSKVKKRNFEKDREGGIYVKVE